MTGACDEVCSSLHRGFKGDLLRPGQSGYEDARGIWNGMFTRRPGLIARCADVNDVQSAVRAASQIGLLTAVRCGGHSLAGFSTCDGGLVIDLSRLRQEGAVVDRVLVERRELREAGVHRARQRIQGCVVTPRRFAEPSRARPRTRSRTGRGRCARGRPRGVPCRGRRNGSATAADSSGSLPTGRRRAPAHRSAPAAGRARDSCAANWNATMLPMSCATTSACSTSSAVSTPATSPAWVFLSKPPAGLEDRPSPRRSGTITVWSRARSAASGAHMSPVSP